MEMKKESNILTEEEPKYIISLKKRYRIIYIVMFVLFLVCTMYFGVISLCAGTDTMIFDIGITVIFLIFLFCSLYGLTRKCERYKGKVVYSFFLTKREYKLSDIRFLYNGIIIKHQKTEPTYTKTSLFLCEKRRFFMARREKGVVPIIYFEKERGKSF